jgi:hypothetical protein
VQRVGILDIRIIISTGPAQTSASRKRAPTPAMLLRICANCRFISPVQPGASQLRNRECRYGKSGVGRFGGHGLNNPVTRPFQANGNARRLFPSAWNERNETELCHGTR